MGGELTVEAAPVRGSCFRFQLGFAVQPDAEAQPETADKNALHGVRALVVDDNAGARELLVRMSQTLGLRVDAVASGDEALARVEEADAADEPYELLLLDWKMPRMDGVECARVLATRPALRHPAPIVIMATAFGREEVRQRLAERQLRVGALLTKPVTPSSLLDACATALGRAASARTRSVRRAEAMVDHRAALAGARILLVEDNVFNQEIAVELLTRAGVVVSVASDGQRALDMLDHERFDAVLMDCQLPVMDGYAATRALRERPSLRSLPVIAMTANAMVGDRDKALAAGMNDHIAKPIKVEEMFATLARWIRPRTAGSVSPAAEDAAETPVDALATLTAIDSRSGIAAMMGDRTLYIHLLRMFRDRETDFAARFRVARSRGATAAAMRMAHDLKSVTGSLAVPEVHDAACELERACIEGADPARIETLLEAVDGRLGPVIVELKTI
jgi:CheY-like chemotaxis protein/HPt (histidine-containing phosphotransfer) domain-containing protein